LSLHSNHWAGISERPSAFFKLNQYRLRVNFFLNDIASRAAVELSIQEEFRPLLSARYWLSPAAVPYLWTAVGVRSLWVL